MNKISDEMMKVFKNKNLLEIYGSLHEEMFNLSFWKNFILDIQKRIVKLENIRANYSPECEVKSDLFYLVLNNKKIAFDVRQIEYGYLLLADARKNPYVKTNDELIIIDYASDVDDLVKFVLRTNNGFGKESILLSKGQIKILQQLNKNPELINFL